MGNTSVEKDELFFQDSYIRNIFIPFYNYEFDHGPSDRDKINEHFRGRKAIKERIQMLFDQSKSKHGA